MDFRRLKFDSMDIEYFERRVCELNKILKEKQKESNNCKVEIAKLKSEIKENDSNLKAFKLQWISTIQQSKLTADNLKNVPDNEKTEILHEITKYKEDSETLSKENETLLKENEQLLLTQSEKQKQVDELKNKLKQHDNSKAESTIYKIDQLDFNLNQQCVMITKQMEFLKKKMDTMSSRTNKSNLNLKQIQTKTESLKKMEHDLSFELLKLKILIKEKPNNNEISKKDSNKSNNNIYETNINNNIYENNTNIENDVLKQQIIKELEEELETERKTNLELKQYLKELKEIKNEDYKITLKDYVSKDSNGLLIFDEDKMKHDVDVGEVGNDNINDENNVNSNTRNDNFDLMSLREDERFLLENCLSFDDDDD